MQDNEVLLEVSGIQKRFPVKRRTLYAVADVSFELRRGEILGILGESGCGKSTLARIVAGSLPASEGSMRLNGADYTRLRGREKRAFRRNIQMVFQDPLSSFSPRMKIGDYLAEPRRNFDHIPKAQALEEAREMLERVGLPRDFGDRYPHELSGGQLQRVAIARAIAIHPSVLICDEATGALDVSIQNRIAELLVNLIEQENIAGLFIGHDPALVRSVSRRIAVMYLGRFVEVIESEVLAESCLHPYTQALLNSVFDVYCDPNAEVSLPEGEPPSPLQLHEGCPFAPRCKRRMDVCLRCRPELKQVEKEHFVACFCAEEI